MGTEALFLSECSGGDIAGVGFREPGEEVADAGIQRNNAGLGLAQMPLRRHGNGQVVLAVVPGDATVNVVVWQPLGHPQVAADGVVVAGLSGCAFGDVPALLGHLAAAESEFVVLASQQARPSSLFRRLTSDIAR